MDIESITPQQAAERAQVSRATIVRALQNRDLHGYRSNSGRWSIRPDDLTRWQKKRLQTVQDRSMNTDHEQEKHAFSNGLTLLLSEQLERTRQHVAEHAERLARLEADAAANAARLAEATADRDAWREQARRMEDREAARSEQPQRPPAFRLLNLFRR